MSRELVGLKDSLLSRVSVGFNNMKPYVPCIICSWLERYVALCEVREIGGGREMEKEGGSREGERGRE